MLRKFKFLAALVLLAFVLMATHVCPEPFENCGHGGACPEVVCINIPVGGIVGPDGGCGGGGGGGAAGTPTASATPSAPPTPTPTPPSWAAGAYGSQLPHAFPPAAIKVKLTDSVRNWDADWAGHYNNARGWWNLQFAAAFPVFADEAVLTSAKVWVLRPAGTDEANANLVVQEAGYTFEPTANCSSTDPQSWATVNSAGPDFSAGHNHRGFQKICVWSTNGLPRATDGNNGQGYHYWWLTLTHELGHVLSLPDLPSDPDSCLMRSGPYMLFPCFSEPNWVHAHYGW